jgi:RHS repeat-associated protein
MLLVNTKEESSANKTVRSDRFVSTLCRPNLATWRHKVSHEADGRGNVLAGGERGGKSHITYRPYGEILRTDSFGPDISKFKYTGQEEDRESGLMYYKARYYDSKIGRFLQSDSLSFYMSEQGMNPYSYVEGNPISYNDPTGFAKCPSKSNWLVAGAWSGAGLCGGFKTDRAFASTLITNIIILYIAGASAEDIQTYSLYLYLTSRPQNALTPIDEASREHDSDDDGFFNGSKKNIRADSNWIKNAWSSSPYYPLGGGFIPRPGYFKQQFKREFDAVGNKCKVGNSGVNARDLCAGINTFGTSLADYGVVLIGTGLFSTDIAISSIRKGIKGLSTIKQEKYYIRNDRFNNNLNIPKISITGKTKNLFKPGKWKL